MPRATERALRAVIFDMDGILVDTEGIWERVRRAFVADHGGRYHDGVTRDLMGMSAPEWSGYIRAKLGVPLTDAEINAGIVDGVSSAMRERLPLYPGAVETVRALAARVPVAVASSSNRSLIDLVVRESGLADVFATTVSSEEVARGKPAPDVYLRAAELLGFAPETCAAIEDSSNGLRAARAAGMFVVAVPNAEYPPTDESLALADVVVATIADVTPAAFDFGRAR